MPIVELQTEDAIGTLTYESSDDGKVEFEVLSESQSLKSLINRYFTKQRTYFIPESQRLDDYREDKDIIPTKDMMYFELALMELSAEKLVEVKWPIDAEGLEKITV